MEALGLVSGVVTIVAVVVSVAQELRQYVSELGRYAKIYGPIGAFLPCISNLRVWKLANDVLQSEDEKVVDSFRQAQVGQANMTAVTVSTKSLFICIQPLNNLLSSASL